ncbi:MAG: hypothetical protein GXO02_04320 [Epsilonproteobacteria bacterium]|nr:hypothetical protein [Campylobacterota bacterium]
MKQTIFKDKYPIWTLELNKSEVKFDSFEEIINYFIEKINAHPIAKYIATFDHFNHTKSLKDGEINPEIKNVQNVIFCFGKEIPNTKVAAVRPRSIAVCELEDKFVIEFLEAPNEKLHSVMEDWAKSLRK